MKSRMPSLTMRSMVSGEVKRPTPTTGLEVGPVNAVVAQLDCRQATVVVDALGHECQCWTVDVVPDALLDEWGDLGRVVDFGLLGTDYRPASFGLHRPHLGVRRHIAIAHATALRDLEEAILCELRLLTGGLLVSTVSLATTLGRPPPGTILPKMNHGMLSSTPMTLTGPFREPAQMLAEQSYGGHKSVHDAGSAAKLGLPGAPIEGPTHFSQFEPLAATLWGDRWFTHGCISAHFQNMVIEGEHVQAQLSFDGPGATMGRIDAHKADGTPVLTGTASIGPEHGDTALSLRLAAAQATTPGRLHIIDQMALGQRGAHPETVGIGFDDHLGDLYPFTLRQKLATITEHLTYHRADASSPWGAPVMPLEMLSVLTNAFSKDAGFVARQPSVGLFIDLEVRMIDGPVLVGRQYRIERELVALGQSRRTESFWTRTTLLEGDRAVAEVLLHQGVFKASYADYPTEPSV